MEQFTFDILVLTRPLFWNILNICTENTKCEVSCYNCHLRCYFLSKSHSDPIMTQAYYKTITINLTSPPHFKNSIKTRLEPIWLAQRCGKSRHKRDVVHKACDQWFETNNGEVSVGEQETYWGQYYKWQRRCQLQGYGQLGGILSMYGRSMQSGSSVCERWSGPLGGTLAYKRGYAGPSIVSFWKEMGPTNGSYCWKKVPKNYIYFFLAQRIIYSSSILGLSSWCRPTNVPLRTYFWRKMSHKGSFV